MKHLKSIKLKTSKLENKYPFNLNTIKSLNELKFDSSVTIFVGENGTGKSTLIKALALSANSIIVDKDISIKEKFKDVEELSNALNLIWGIKTRKGFYLSSEDFINYKIKLERIKSEMKERLAEIDEEFKNNSEYAKNLAKIPYKRSLSEIEELYDGSLKTRSHGEGFLRFFQSRIVSNGFYILDEPETPLSPMNQLTLVGMINEMVKLGCQFIIATHSPIIMAIPGAEIIDFDNIPIGKTDFNDLQHVKFMKAFLSNPEGFIRHIK